MGKLKFIRGKRASLLMIGLAFAPALIFLLFTLTRVSNNFQSLPVISELPEYSFTDKEGNILSNETQKGKTTLFTTIQSSCPNKCAVDLFKINLSIYQDYRKDRKEFKDIELVSILTDEEGNPIDNFEEIEFMLNDMMEGYDPTIWKLVSGDPKQIYDIENNEGVNLYNYKPSEEETFYQNKAYLETMLLIDKNNQLRYLGLGNQEGYIRDFKQHVALLRQEYKKQAKEN